MRRKKILCGLLSLSLLFSCNYSWNCMYVTASAKVADEQETGQTKVEAENLDELASTDYVENELLVTYKNPDSNISGLPKGTSEETVTDNCSLITVDESKMKEAIQTIATDSDVLYVEPNYTVKLFETNDKFSSKQWAYYNATSNINAQKAWALGKGENEEVIVAVIDTGIDYQHADLAENIWKNTNEAYQSTADQDGNGYAGDYYGWNFSDNNNVICNYEYSRSSQAYVDYHGTHVAGIIGAVADNGVGIAGLASYSNVKLMSVKVMGMYHSGSVSDIVKAIAYAENNGATICNLSLGTDEYSKTLYEAMKQSSMLFVCAAGNGDETTNGYGYDISKDAVFPACYDLDNIISVANANSTGELDSSSCYSATEVDIAAPGTAIASTYVDPSHTESGVYVESTGTSMAAPFVTATAAMVSSFYGGLSATQIKNMILGGSKKVEENDTQVINGAYLDVYGALTCTGMIASVRTTVKDINNSNNKKYVIKVDNPRMEDLTLRYAAGKKSKAYFDEGNNGTSLTLSNNKASIKIKATKTYTVYLKDSLGNEAVYTEKITVPSLTKLTLSTSKKTLKVGDSYRLKTELADDTVYADITYKSSNKNIVKVSSAGKLVAKNTGTATIKVTAKTENVTKTATCKVTVK